ncbi:triose-phosphate isomerase [Bacillus sp. NSP9.1]|uniref:triose-phosphate isomerase n=1 Tax=Bacillus sp. NSP9.1 TaxID=1071078 RepID=UPI000413F5EF|nr:triose-phosphate isomerase [Bacillus sp. NSP9.1]QHZ48463.1 triose-phosphate isomerase [Bacillus sp. NSP9.1]
MNKIWIGTNWKMTKTTEEGLSYTKDLKEFSKSISESIELFIIPSYTSLWPLHEETEDSPLLLGAQNMHWEESGAFTGEISPRMLREIGIDIVELGHSERRQYFNEDDEMINKKVVAALKFGMKPLICIGEDIEQKNQHRSREVLADQLSVCLQGLSRQAVRNILIAYEPVWAIGEKGVPADADYVEDIHEFLRGILENMFGETGKEIPLLFGGSVNKDNFLQYMNIGNVNGLFIGRAAWDIASFKQILHQLDQEYVKDGVANKR